MFTALLLSLSASPVTVAKPPAVMQARKADDPWARVYARVKSGESIYTEYVPGEPKGRYLCYLDAKGVLRYKSVPAVTAPSPFPERHAGHDCPSCHASQFRIASFNTDGTHTHICSRCGLAWKH